MKTQIPLLVLLMTSTIHLSLFVNKQVHYEYAQEKRTSFALIELFTSEGCSSCPRADKFLSELSNAYRAKNQPFFFLAFHVDYWDQYGWTDIYGKSEFTKRQRKYGSYFNLESVYTPQLVINGSEEMVGSDPKARTLIESALQKPAPVVVTLEPVIGPVKKKINLHYKLSDIPEISVLNIAVVESGLVREIWKGENKGQTLKHDNVVRYFKTINKPVADGYVEFGLLSDIHIENCTIVVYIQDVNTGHILGANDLKLKNN
jgi:hypothetical protein